MSKWYKASELERLNTPMPMDGVNGLPDNHVITVSERTIEIDESELVQNNVSTDTFTLELDAEWDDITPVVIFSNSKGDYKVAYENGPTKIPAAAMAVIGSVDVSVFGLDSTGAVRVVTKAAPNTMDVVESGKFVGEISEDDVSLLGQILAAVEAANEAAENANATIIKSAVATTLNPGEPATANLADNVLTLGIPKGEKGDKGDPGQDGVTPFTQASVTTLEPGSPATVAIEEDTLKLGIPKGDKGDKGDQGDKGETGDKGDPGTAATIAVGSVTGLDAGASPTVVNSGTSTAARFDFGIPKGDKGDTGDPGHTPQRGVDYWTAEDVEGVVEDAKARAVAELAEIGNVPKKTVTDLVAHAEDAYAQKPVEVRIKGRTVKNLWPAINTTNKGVTVATADTGITTLSGQNTADDNSFPYVSIEGVVAGKQYTLTLSSVTGMNTETFYVYAQAHGADDGYLNSFTLATETSKTITLPAGTTSFRCGFIIRSGQSVNWSGRIMLVEGTEAPDCFTPPASIMSVQPGNLVTAGKNLLSVYSDMPRKTSNANIEDGDIVVGIASNGLIDPSKATDIEISDGEVSVNILSSGCGLGFVRYLPQGTPFAVSLVGSNKVRATFSYVSAEKTVANRNDFNATDFDTTGVVPNGCIGVCIIIRNKDEIPGAVTCYPQLELGSTATAYEPPNVVEVALPETDPLMSINGKSDVLSIASDGSVSVERHVERGDITEEALQTGILYPSADSAPPYFVCNLDITPYASSDDFSKDGVSSSSSYSSSSRYTFIGASKDAPEGVTRGLYRTWNSNVFWDEEFTDIEQARQLILSGGGSVWAQVPESVEQLGTVALPVLPAPTFNQYHDADVPSDTSTTYTRDINIALADLEARIADLVTKEAANV